MKAAKPTFFFKSAEWGSGTIVSGFSTRLTADIIEDVVAPRLSGIPRSYSYKRCVEKSCFVISGTHGSTQVISATGA
jgi:hypothetical protein